MHIVWKNPVLKSYILDDSNYIAFYKWQSYGDIKRISGCQGLGREGGMCGVQGNKAVKLCDTIMVNT